MVDFWESTNTCSRVRADQYLLKEYQIISFVADAIGDYNFLTEIQQKCMSKHYSKPV